MIDRAAALLAQIAIAIAVGALVVYGLRELWLTWRARGGGAGLGLSIARELAERMGATVSAENTGRGDIAFALAFPSLATQAQQRLREFSRS